MNIIFFVCFGVLLISVHSANSCACKKDTPLKLIFQVIPHFKEVQVCNRKCYTNYGVSKDGVRRISYQCKLSENESPIDLCSCVYGYLSQRDWLNGSIQSCCVRKNIATLTLEGEPDPTYNEEADHSDEECPIEQLKDIFNQFHYAELEGLHCIPSTPTDESGNIHFNIQCDLKPDSPCKEDICDGILRYLNQDKWLGKLTSICTSDGKILKMEILGGELHQ